jgi:uncharacterized membrane protein YphA (DoxX/SURF4 family)
MNAIANYFKELTNHVGSGWNRFWFTPADVLGVCVLRIFVGLMSAWFILSYSHDLGSWWGANGLLPNETVQQLIGDLERWNGRASYFYFIDDPQLLWVVHIVGILMAVAFTLGFFTRLTSIATLIVVLSYIHRAPMVTGQFEPVLTLMLFYLSLAPCGAELSLDSWLKRRRTRDLPQRKNESDRRCLAAGISQRLMQVHLAAMYLMMGLTKLGGSDAWWVGESAWWLIAHTESRLIDLTFLHQFDVLIQVWTLGIVAFELLYGVLIWNRFARPLLIAISVVHFLLIGLLTGLLSFAAIMIFANLAFVSPQWLRQMFGSARAELQPA